MKLFDIHQKLTLAFVEAVYTLVSAKHRIYGLTIGQTILTNETRPGRPSIDLIDELIFKNLTKSLLPQFDH
jgi:hypothetical protein